MATIRSLADEFGMQPYGLRAFANGYIEAADDMTELDAETEAFLREAITHVTTDED